MRTRRSSSRHRMDVRFHRGGARLTNHHLEKRKPAPVVTGCGPLRDRSSGPDRAEGWQCPVNNVLQRIKKTNRVANALQTHKRKGLFSQRLSQALLRVKAPHRTGRAQVNASPTPKRGPEQGRGRPPLRQLPDKTRKKRSRHVHPTVRKAQSFYEPLRDKITPPKKVYGEELLKGRVA